jgi:redox-sensing transcriptional repressor
VARRKPFEIIILAVPGDVAQEVVDAVVAAGTRGILNFAPAKLDVPPGVAVREVDLSIAMESLSFALSR